jgi:Ribosomal protein L7/L12 C-terminal domain
MRRSGPPRVAATVETASIGPAFDTRMSTFPYPPGGALALFPLTQLSRSQQMPRVVDAGGKTVKEKISKEDADKLKATLEAAGAKIK